MAGIALHATNNLSRVLSASQLGITLASLALGWVAEDTLGVTFARWFSVLPIGIDQSVRLSIAAGVALTIATFMHVIFGELAPKAMALNSPERFARWLAPPLFAFSMAVAPLTWVLNRASWGLVRLMGVRGDISPESVHSPEELRMIAQQ